jgi:hypothetical protein
MIKDYFYGRAIKSKVGILITALLVGGISAQASGVLNSPAGGYLICVDSKTKLITHPGTSKCPKGSKGLVIGAAGKDGAIGLTGAAGLNGLDGKSGKDGKTLWNGVKDPESTWGAPGDMYINSITKTLFGPKNLDGTWPASVSMVGPTGPTGLTGAAGTNASLKIPELSICGNSGTSLCKVGVQGPGGGLVFFVDYQDEHSDFNYLEVSPSSCEKADEVAYRGFGVYFSDSEPFDETVTASLMNYSGQLVGSGSRNTQVLLNSFSTPSNAIAAYYADSLTCGTKTDWFLGSLGEYWLLERNLPGYLYQDSTQPWSSDRKSFWTSSISVRPGESPQKAYGIEVEQGIPEFDDYGVGNVKRVRAIRSF